MTLCAGRLLACVAGSLGDISPFRKLYGSLEQMSWHGDWDEMTQLSGINVS